MYTICQLPSKFIDSLYTFPTCSLLKVIQVAGKSRRTTFARFTSLLVSFSVPCLMVWGVVRVVRVVMMVGVVMMVMMVMMVGVSVLIILFIVVLFIVIVVIVIVIVIFACQKVCANFGGDLSTLSNFAPIDFA